MTETLRIQPRNQQSPVNIHALVPSPHSVDSDRTCPAAFAKPEGAPETGINPAADLRNLMRLMGQTPVRAHPAEVAQAAIQGLRDNQFRIVPLNPDTKQKIRARFDSILNRSERPIARLG